MDVQSQFVCHEFPEAIRTDRLLLRRWQECDRDGLATMSGDAQVMEHYPSPLSREQSNALADRIEIHFQTYGFGLFAVEIPQQASFAGFVGLNIPRFEAHFTPCVELGWRLGTEFRGQGFATEAARAVVDQAFARLSVSELVAMTIPANVRSQRVMQKLGMSRDPRDDFDHPLVPNSPLSRHVLYRLVR